MIKVENEEKFTYLQ